MVTLLDAVAWAREFNPSIRTYGMESAIIGVAGRGGFTPTLVFDRVMLVGLVGEDTANRHICLVRRGIEGVLPNVECVCRDVETGQPDFTHALLGYSFRTNTVPCAVYNTDKIRSYALSGNLPHGPLLILTVFVSVG